MLLAHHSPFQIYCANRLFAAGALDDVIVEAGTSVPTDRPTLRGVLSAGRAAIENLKSDPARGWYRAALQLVNVANRGRYYGHRALHHERLLVGHDYFAFAQGLKVVHVDSINAPDAFHAMEEAHPDLVFVHGTSLIGRSLLERIEAPFVNLHWGSSPRYRGEGIVSALALEGPEALGVTVHMLDAGIDSGPILYQADTSVDSLDNFYSIGVKLTLLGTELFLRVFKDFSEHRRLETGTRSTTASRLFSGRYMRAHPDVYPKAWRNLQAAVRRRT